MKQIPELKLPEFEITPDQFQELLIDFFEKIDAIRIKREDESTRFTEKRDALIAPLRSLIGELMVHGKFTPAKFTLSGRV